MTNVANLILVNLLFLITCIPVVTIGAALCGLYKVTFEILEKEEVFVIRDYFTTFLKKFKNGTLLWIPLLLIDLIMFYSMLIVNSGIEGTATWMLIPPWIVVILSLCIICYAFPYTANYEDTVRNTVKKSVILGMSALPTTVMLSLIHAATIDVMLSTNTFQVVLGSILLFMGCATIALLCSVFVRRVFNKFLVEEEASDEVDSGEDASDGEDTSDNLSDTSDSDDDESAPSVDGSASGDADAPDDADDSDEEES